MSAEQPRLAPRIYMANIFSVQLFCDAKIILIRSISRFLNKKALTSRNILGTRACASCYHPGLSLPRSCNLNKYGRSVDPIILRHGNGCARHSLHAGRMLNCIAASLPLMFGMNAPRPCSAVLSALPFSKWKLSAADNNSLLFFSTQVIYF